MCYCIFWIWVKCILIVLMISDFTRVPRTFQTLEWEEFLLSVIISFVSFIPFCSTFFASPTPKSLHWVTAFASLLSIYLQASSAPKWPSTYITASIGSRDKHWSEVSVPLSPVSIICCWEECVSESTICSYSVQMCFWAMRPEIFFSVHNDQSSTILNKIGSSISKTSKIIIGWWKKSSFSHKASLWVSISYLKMIV